MNAVPLLERVLASASGELPGSTRTASIAGIALGLVGCGLALVGPRGSLFTALYISTVLVSGIAVSGVVLSAIFEMTGAKWGRAYRRLAEGSVALMPLGFASLLALVIAGATGAGALPWARGAHLEGGRAVWLTLPFWSARVLLGLLAAYAVSLLFLYHSLRRDLCLRAARERFSGPIARLVARGITEENAPAEAERSGARLARLAPVVAIVYAVVFTFLGFDLVMALEPSWNSTLFGAWIFFGHLFAGLALLAVASLALRGPLGLADLLDEKRQRDLATLLLAFTLVNIDFFWSQYLTIWYGNLPEETGYIIRRTIDPASPYTALSWPTLAAFFFIPFVALIFRRVKRGRLLLGSVSLVVVLGLFLARFLEIAPPLLGLPLRAGVSSLLVPLAASLLVLVGFGGAGWWLYRLFLRAVPIVCAGDPVLVRALDAEEGHR
jgi:hypothetical protein